LEDKMIIKYEKREKGETVKEWSFEMGGSNARRIEWENRRKERERVKALKKMKKEQKKGGKKQDKKEVDFWDTVENYSPF